MRIINENAVDTIFVMESDDERYCPEEGHRLWMNIKEELPSSMFESISQEEVEKSIKRWKNTCLFGEPEFSAEYKDSTLKVTYNFGDWIVGLRDYSERSWTSSGELVRISNQFWISLWDQAHKSCEELLQHILKDILKDNYDRLNILSYDGNLYYRRCKIRGEL